MEAKRKELQRLNGAYKNTLKNAGELPLAARAHPAPSAHPTYP